MFDLGYVKQEEVPQIPRLAKGPKAIVYSPLGDAHGEPDVALFPVKPAGAMLLQEAANRAGGKADVHGVAGVAATRDDHQPGGKMRCTW
jgi:uncharacterized protein (DUF169 family)